VALDGDELAHQFPQHRGLIPGARSDLEHAVVGIGREELGHPRDDVGLRDRLTLADRKSVVTVRGVAVGGADELVTRNTGHRVEDPPVADPEPLELAHHVDPRASDVHAHMMPLTGEGSADAAAVSSSRSALR